MGFSEDYYLHFHGEQKGPYSFAQLKRLYDKNMIAEETLYWRDGLEQWQPVSDLCGAPIKVQRKRRLEKRLIAGAVLLVIALLVTPFAPVVREGWKETNQHRYSSEAAYWMARGLVRDALKKRGATVSFSPFDSTAVQLTGFKEAQVFLSGTVFVKQESGAPLGWDVALTFAADRKEWQLVSLRRSGNAKP